jgi:type IV secretory pathway ATPase VirB11/archaellum biosynthesis ATPase
MYLTTNVCRQREFLAITSSQEGKKKLTGITKRIHSTLHKCICQYIPVVFLSLQASSQKNNPFTYGNSSNSNGTAPPAVSGNVVSFSIKNASGDPMPMNDLAEPFVMVIPQDDPEVYYNV